MQTDAHSSAPSRLASLTASRSNSQVRVSPSRQGSVPVRILRPSILSPPLSPLCVAVCGFNVSFFSAGFLSCSAGLERHSPPLAPSASTKDLRLSGSSSAPRGSVSSGEEKRVCSLLLPSSFLPAPLQPASASLSECVCACVWRIKRNHPPAPPPLTPSLSLSITALIPLLSNVAPFLVHFPLGSAAPSACNNNGGDLGLFARACPE